MWLNAASVIVMNLRYSRVCVDVTVFILSLHFCHH